MKLVNFSHPLHPDTERVLREEYGVTEIIHYPVHFNLGESLDAQVQAIVDDVRARYGEPDVIIPPGYAPAAILLAEAFPYRMVRLASTGTPPKWMPAELLYLGTNPPIPVDQVVQLLHAINAWFGENPEAAPYEPPWAKDFYALMEKLENLERPTPSYHVWGESRTVSGTEGGVSWTTSHFVGGTWSHSISSKKE